MANAGIWTLQGQNEPSSTWCTPIDTTVQSYGIWCSNMITGDDDFVLHLASGNVKSANIMWKSSVFGKILFDEPVKFWALKQSLSHPLDLDEYIQFNQLKHHFIDVLDPEKKLGPDDMRSSLGTFELMDPLNRERTKFEFLKRQGKLKTIEIKKVLARKRSHLYIFWTHVGNDQLNVKHLFLGDQKRPLNDRKIIDKLIRLYTASGQVVQFISRPDRKKPKKKLNWLKLFQIENQDVFFNLDSEKIYINPKLNRKDKFLDANLLDASVGWGKNHLLLDNDNHDNVHGHDGDTFQLRYFKN